MTFSLVVGHAFNVLPAQSGYFLVWRNFIGHGHNIAGHETDEFYKGKKGAEHIRSVYYYINEARNIDLDRDNENVLELQKRLRTALVRFQIRGF